MRPEELETVLRGLARAEAWPATPPLADGVRERVEEGPQPVEVTHARTWASRWRPALTAAAVLALALTIGLSTSGTVRKAVADVLGVVGIRVSFGDGADVPPPTGRPIRLGTPVSHSKASELAGFDVRVPAYPSEPPAFHYDPDVGAGGMASLAYPRSATRLSEVDILVTQFAASVDEAYLDKEATAGTRILPARVGPEEGYWLTGAPHVLYQLDLGGEIREETVRLVGKVLLWEEDGITYRVEGAASLQEALRIARSLR